jgi:N-methylhydantoinase B
MNDTYLTEGCIGHLPDLCSTVPVFHGGEVVAYIQAFGHHDDIGGRVPGSMPGTAQSVFEEGLAVPPIRVYSEGKRNEEAFKIIRRNTRLPEILSADLDSEIQACIMGARRMEELFQRFGAQTVEACFQAIIGKCRDTFRNEPVSRHDVAKLGSDEAGRFSGSRSSNRTRIGIATPSPQTMHSRLRRAGITSRNPRAPSGIAERTWA